MNPAIFMFDSPSYGNDQDNNQCCGCFGAQNQENLDCNEALEDEKSKVSSEITKTGQPYKEIEAIINDNRLVLRVQKLREIEEEWDPPCDCLPGISSKQVDLKSSDNQFRGANTFSGKSKFPVSNPNSNQRPQNFEKTTQRPNIDLIENPNMFLLRIRKRSQTGDKRRENIDLEFQFPRPYKPKPVEKKKRKLIPENPVAEQKEVISIEEEQTKSSKKSKKQKKKK